MAEKNTENCNTGYRNTDISTRFNQKLYECSIKSIQGKIGIVLINHVSFTI